MQTDSCLGDVPDPEPEAKSEMAPKASNFGEEIWRQRRSTRKMQFSDICIRSEFNCDTYDTRKEHFNEQKSRDFSLGSAEMAVSIPTNR